MAKGNIEPTEKPGGSDCTCGHHPVEFPELDVQQIPGEVRHSTIFGALEAIQPGRGLIIRATHDPIPLLQQLGQCHPGKYNMEYL